MIVSRSELDRFRDGIALSLGLHFDDTKLELLADVLRSRIEAVGLTHPAAYLERLSALGGATQETQALADSLTVGETFFFRNADHFRALREIALPAAARSKQYGTPLRIVSAGCASGEEPYSLAMVVRDTPLGSTPWNVRIDAFDVNPVVLDRARLGIYSAWALRATPDSTKAQYFRPAGRDFVLDPAVRQMVRIEERNLVHPDPLFWQEATFDIVFCRNVLMYLTPAVMSAVVARITRALVPGGHLFLGHAETLRGMPHDFHLCHTHDTFYYRKRDASRDMRDVDRTTDATTTPRRSVAAMAAPAADTSWVDVIQRATDRITLLATDSTRRATATQITGSPDENGVLAPPRNWDLALILETMRQERFDHALAMLAALPGEAQRDAHALLLRAVLLTNSARLSESDDVCRDLLALDELNAGAHYLLALSREHAGDHAGAIEHDRTAVGLDASFALPHLHLGLLARRAADAPTAQRELAEAVVLLAREDASRLLLFGGGFSRETLIQFCRGELRSAGGAP